MSRRRVFLVGTFPPPLHGMAAVNQALLEKLTAAGVSVVALNTAPKTLKRDLLSRFSRLPALLGAWKRLLAAKRGEQLYLAPSGGWGQVYDLVTVSLAQLKGVPCVMHHHSFAYLQQRRRLSAAMMRVAGKDALHVVLCPAMASALRERYGVTHTLVLSNLVFFPAEPFSRPRNALRTIGFLSNITREKGGETVLALAQAIKERGLPLKVLIAGPCHEQHLAQKLRQAASEGMLEWRGAVYGEEKARFWRDIDAFVFPTEYRNEAEPLVVWEAMAAGVPVISYGRGCVANQVENAGIVLPAGVNFVESALEILAEWSENKALYQEMASKARRRYQTMRLQAEQQWQDLVSAMGGM